MARGVSPAPTSLPKVSFVKVEDKSLTEPAGVHDVQARSFGYNDFSAFERPEHYIRYIEPLEHDLAVQVEYDMDEQDHEWLDAVNAERKKEQLDKVSYETFEIVMDRLEKEWFDLTKTLPKPDMAMPSEDSTCAICDDAEGENTNAIVFCDGCNLAVHQDCYGVPYIPEGQWLCRKCTVSPETPVSCILCPNEGGAFKQTVHGEWVHLLCAIWVPETRVVNEVFMEPITGIDRISKQRWKLRCSVCEVREGGACIQCSKSSCFLAFHPTCARKEKLLMPMKAMQGSEAPSLTCFCEKHLPKEQQDARLEALSAEQESAPQGESTKTARAYATTYTSGPPLVPALVVDRIIHYIHKIGMRKRNEFVLTVCKYWSLKREGRRGAPLLKRLHLEPWTATNSSGSGGRGSEEEKALKLEYMKKLRQDLESVRLIADLTRKRESKKLEQAQSIQDVLSKCIYPHEARLRFTFERIITSDRNEYFKYPVSKTEVPDYFDVIKNPMCWNAIDTKLDRHEYWDTASFKRDILLVLENAALYNKYDTPFYKTAHRIKTLANKILPDLDSLIVPARLQLPNDRAVEPVETPISASMTQLSLGNLEPRLDVLETLIAPHEIEGDEEMKYLLEDSAPVEALFNYELGKPKPPPPSPSPPPPPPKKTKGKKKGKKPDPIEGVDVAALDASPGFKAPRTRRGVAAAVAFEAEANAIPSSSTLPDADIDPQQKEKSKRAVAAQPGPLVEPPLVDSLDDRESFKLFEKGWILPDSQKRRGRVAPVPIPLPSKKRKIEAKKAEAKAEAEAMDVDDAPISAESVSEAPAAKTAWKGKGKAKKEVVVIEELDTPATRREKSMKRKAERQARLAAEAGGEQAKENSLSPLSEADSEDGDTDEEGAETRKKSAGVGSASTNTKRKQPAPVQKVERGMIELGPDGKIEGGTLVWAKSGHYPWWAGVVFDPDSVDVPVSLLATPHNPDHHLVRFFDKNNSWGWLDLSRLRQLGEDKELDEDMLAPKSQRQKWKSANIRYDCRNSWRRAMAEMETAEEALEVPDNQEGVPEVDGLPDPMKKDEEMQTAEQSLEIPGDDAHPDEHIENLDTIIVDEMNADEEKMVDVETSVPPVAVTEEDGDKVDVAMEEIGNLSDLSELSDG